MNSITYGIGYFLAILVVNVFSSDYYTLLSEEKFQYDRIIPLNFGYKKDKNFLLMAITLKNISPSVTAVSLKYNQYNNKYLWCQSGPEVKSVNVEKNTSEVKFMILKNLMCDHIVVDVELNSEQGICDTTNIAEGRDENTLIKKSINGNWYIIYYQDERILKYYDMTGNCLAPKSCEIIVDLGNKCPEPPPTTAFSCNIEESEHICTFTYLQNTDKHRFYQTYNNGSFVGPAPELKATVTKILIKLELFDNNTSVNVATSLDKKIIWSKELNLSAKDISKDYSITQKLMYSDTKVVEYRCQEHNNTNGVKCIVHVGLINTDNKITTYKITSIKRKFKMADNGTILCCLFYKTVYNNGQQVYISRVVEKKTLLIYQSQESNNLTESGGQTMTSPTDWLIYLVPLFLGICVVVLALYIIKLKRCCKNSHPEEETVELDNHATQNQVLYANLDFVRDDNNQPQCENEEPHYANIAGVLHPL